MSAEDFQSLRSSARKELLDALTAHLPGKKVMYMDESLSSMVSLTLDVADLKNVGVDSWAKLDSPDVFRFEDQTCGVVFLVRSSNLFLFDFISLHLSPSRLNLVLLVHPSSLSASLAMGTSIGSREGSREGGGCLAKEILQDKPCEVVNISKLFLTVLESDLCDLEISGIFRDFHIFGGTWKLSTLAAVLGNFPKFPIIHSIGHASQFVAELLCKSYPSHQCSSNCSSKHSSSIHSSSKHSSNSELILIDRSIDMLSIIASQFSYESTIDETLGIKGGYVRRKFLYDELFREVRGRNFAQVSEFFKSKAESIQKVYREKEGLQEISDLHEYMEKFKVTQTAHTLLSWHVNLAKDISDQVSDRAALLEAEDGLMSGRLGGGAEEEIKKMMEKGETVDNVMKIGMMQGIVSGNFLGKQTIKDILQNYGIEYMGLMENTEILIKNLAKNFWKIKDIFDLVPEREDALGEGYAGYVPLTVRLIERKERWREHTEALNLLNGPVLEINTGRGEGELVVCFVGGVTYGEINALRVLAQKQKKQISVITTEILNCKSFFHSLAEF